MDKDLCINPPRISLKALIQRGSMLFMVFQNISYIRCKVGSDLPKHIAPLSLFLSSFSSLGCQKRENNPTSLMLVLVFGLLEPNETHYHRDLDKPTHTLVLCWMPEPLPPRNQCTAHFPPALPLNHGHWQSPSH